MAATNLRPAQTYAIRATEGFTVRTLDKDRQWALQGLRLPHPSYVCSIYAEYISASTLLMQRFGWIPYVRPHWGVRSPTSTL